MEITLMLKISLCFFLSSVAVYYVFLLPNNARNLENLVNFSFNAVVLRQRSNALFFVLIRVFVTIMIKNYILHICVVMAYQFVLILKCSGYYRKSEKERGFAVCFIPNPTSFHYYPNFPCNIAITYYLLSHGAACYPCYIPMTNQYTHVI